MTNSLKTKGQWIYILSKDGNTWLDRLPSTVSQRQIKKRLDFWAKNDHSVCDRTNCPVCILQDNNRTTTEVL